MWRDYDAFKKVELLYEARRRNLGVPSSALKSDIIAALKADDEQARGVSRGMKTATSKKTAKMTVAPPIKSVGARVGGPSRPASRRSPSRSVTADPRKERPAPKRPERNWEIDPSSEKFYVGRDLRDYEEKNIDPESFSNSSVTLMPRDPYTLFVYWGVADGDAEGARAALGAGWESVTWTLRIVDLTNSGDRRIVTDMPVMIGAGDRYISVDRAGARYQATIGLADSSGRFVAIATSNIDSTAPAAPQWGGEVSESEDYYVDDATFNELYQLSTGGVSPAYGFTGGGASELLGRENSESLFSGSFPSSSSVRQIGGSEGRLVPDKGRDFFFWLDCELIVRGGTAPDASVVFQGEPIRLNADGTFSARFYLPDGVIDIPVSATSADKVETRTISPSVIRTTWRSENAK